VPESPSDREKKEREKKEKKEKKVSRPSLPVLSFPLRSAVSQLQMEAQLAASELKIKTQVCFRLFVSLV
jgi:hypothetical protein